MNNSNENLEEDSKENLEDEFKDQSEVLPDKEKESNDVMEIQVDSKENLEDEFKDQSEVLPVKENESNDVMEIQDEVQDTTKEVNIEKPEIENLDLINETIAENLESEVDEKEILEKELRDFHRNLIEASLYAAGRTLTIEEISNKLELPKKEVEELINEVAFEYLERSTALVIAQIGD
ncbi:MAG: SMC-Scp complex subunit ScpB, partial [Candidatus Lokiarchaeota archaeon]|nr:SMC-Scp complex subunit ScpB [Candidatus Lokiarchaeota archaeon]